MQTNDLLIDGFERVRQIIHTVLDDISEDALTYRPNDTGNSVAWLVWHLARIQDDHLADVRAADQVWPTGGWYEKSGIKFTMDDTGYGHTSDEVAAVTIEAKLLTGYYDAVHAETVKFIKTLKADDYDTIVDESWDPPVTLAVRLLSILADDIQHAGQAAYVKGLLSQHSVLE